MDVDGIKRIAHLARLNIDESAIPGYAENMTNILRLADKLQSVETDCEPLSHPLEIKQRLREDKVTEEDQHELFQSLAPEVAYDLYLVPQVIEQE